MKIIGPEKVFLGNISSAKILYFKLLRNYNTKLNDMYTSIVTMPNVRFSVLLHCFLSKNLLFHLNTKLWLRIPWSWPYCL